MELGLAAPRTHDLIRLHTSLLPHHASLRSLFRGLYVLNRYAVEVRYPGDDPTKRQAEAALRWAGKVRTAARALLGVRDRPPRRKR